MRGLPFRSAAFRYLLGKTSSLIIVRSFHCGCCLCGIAKSVAAIGLSKLDCAPKGRAVSTAYRSPESASLCRRPWLAVRAVDGDGAENFDHGVLSVRCSVAMRSSAVPSGPDARPCELRDKACRITSGLAPHCTAIENTIAESRALVSAALLLLWLLRNSSAIEPSGNQPTVHV